MARRCFNHVLTKRKLKITDPFETEIVGERYAQREQTKTEKQMQENRFYVKPVFGHFAVMDRTTEKMSVAYHRKNLAVITAKGLNEEDPELVEEIIKKLKTVENYGYYININ
jgi:glycerol-3-phosphate dehydrogenase